MTELDRSPSFGPYRGLTWRRLSHRLAIKEFRQAIEQNPEDAMAYYNRGIAYARSQRYKQAVEDLGRAIELNPEDAAAYYNRGLAYAQLQDYGRAIKDYVRVIKLYPKYAPRAYYNRGLAYAQLQDYARALEDFRRAIELDSKFFAAHYDAACVYALMGKKRDAFEWLEKAIGLNRKCRRVAWSDKAFVGVREDERFKALIGVSEFYGIIPGESVGPFKLGMTRDEIGKLSIRPMKEGEGSFPQPGIYVYYDEAGRCNKIVAIFGYKLSPPIFTLLGHIVNGMTDKEAARILRSIAADVRFGYASVESLSAGLRAIKWEASDDKVMCIQVIPGGAPPASSP